MRRKVAQAVLAAPLAVDTRGRRFPVEWEPDAPVTPLGPLVFFRQFLATAGWFHDGVQSCPLEFQRNNAPALNDLLGTITPAMLAGQHRDSHGTALRADTVNPSGLGLSKVCGDASYGHEGLLAQGEERGPKYLFRLRHSPGGKPLRQTLAGQWGQPSPLVLKRDT